MVRNNYTPQGVYYPQVNPGIQPFPSNQMTCAYVQGKEAAKAYPIGPGQFAILVNTEDSYIYTKTTDQYGRPMPIRIFKCIEEFEESDKQQEYVTKSDLDNVINEIKELLKPKQNNFKNQSAKEDKQ